MPSLEAIVESSYQNIDWLLCYDSIEKSQESVVIIRKAVTSRSFKKITVQTFALFGKPTKEFG